MFTDMIYIVMAYDAFLEEYKKPRVFFKFKENALSFACREAIDYTKDPMFKDDILNVKVYEDKVEVVSSVDPDETYMIYEIIKLEER